MPPTRSAERTTHAVVFRFRPSEVGATRSVQLFGEVCDWVNPIAMIRQPDGAFEAAMDLPTGVYAYKLVVDGEWRLDRDNLRTRSTGGLQNNIVSLGGADEPILHAPAAPYVCELDGGGVRITAGVRRGTSGRLAVRWCEDDFEPTRETPMSIAAEEDEHVIFEAKLPTSARRVRYRLTLQTPAEPVSVVAPPEYEPPFVHARPVGDRPTPTWWREAVVYTIYVDRFRPARDRAGWERDPGRGKRAGGHLDGLRRSLDELRDLGVSVLYLTPIHVGESSHRYDLVDPLTVDSDLGGADGFEALVRDAHAKGLRIILDLSFSHAGLSFPPCQDVLAHGKSSRYSGWFLWSDEDPSAASAGSRQRVDADLAQLRHYGRRRDAPLLNLGHPEVEALVIQAVERWVAFGVDGLRLDMAAEVPLALARRIRARMLALRPDAIVLGELVPAHAWRWTDTGAIDAATDFGFHAIVTDLVARRAITPRQAVAKLRGSDLSRGGPAATSVRFVSTHDHARLATIASHVGALERARLGLVLLLTMPGIPALLYGEEVGLHAPHLEELREDAWADRMPMPWTSERRDLSVRDLVRTLIATRRASRALQRGTFDVLHADETLLVFRRSGAGEVVDVYVNVGDTSLELEIADDERSVLEPLVAVGEAVVDHEVVRLPARGALVARRLAPAALRTRLHVVTRDRDFEHARPIAACTPTRIDFSVTEQCNLRCEHCITLAPARTANGSARTLSPWVLERVRPWLARATYFGFVHGGESLTAPIFFDLLDAIRTAHGPVPYVAHLLSNGLLLTETTVLRLARLGVNSISVSLDGATATTNDAIRLGGRFDTIVGRLRDLVAMRRAADLDLRVGLSFVVMRQNLGEIPAMVDLAADLGVDWLKLEETVAVNTFATRSLLGLDPESLRAAVAGAQARAVAQGVVLVDHTVERSIFRCTLGENAEVAAFVAADEYANRSEIHPCRAPWEVACVEPNGDVRLGHFFGPILGNIATGTLDEAWNSVVAQQARAASHAQRLCDRAGPVTCLAR